MGKAGFLSFRGIPDALEEAVRLTHAEGKKFYVTMNAYPYNRSGTGISFGLLNFQKLEDDEPLGGFRASAAADFGEPDEDDDFFD